jgi:hypothetical protein
VRGTEKEGGEGGRACGPHTDSATLAAQHAPSHPVPLLTSQRVTPSKRLADAMPWSAATAFSSLPTCQRRRRPLRTSGGAASTSPRCGPSSTTRLTPQSSSGGAPSRAAASSTAAPSCRRMTLQLMTPAGRSWRASSRLRSSCAPASTLSTSSRLSWRISTARGRRRRSTSSATSPCYRGHQATSAPGCRRR